MKAIPILGATSRHGLLALVVTVGSLSSGCAQWTRYSNANFAGGASMVTDVKHRVIVTGAGGEKRGNYVICAEPSPDALSAVAAQYSLGSTRASGNDIALTAAQQETAVNIGLRTQSIQLLRDSLYRLCEGYLSGAIDKTEYDVLMRRYQRYMVALLAIEQLTSAGGKTHVSAAAVVSGGQVPEVIQAYLVEIAKERGSTVKAIQAQVDEQVKLVEAEKDEAKKKPLQEVLDALKSSLKLAKAAKSKADDAVLTSSVASSSAPGGNDTSPSDAEPVSAVIAQVVDGIARSVLDIDETGQLCFNLLSRKVKSDEAPSEKLRTYCNARNMAIVDNQVAWIADRRQLVAAYVDFMKQNSENKPETSQADSKSIAPQAVRERVIEKIEKLFERDPGFGDGSIHSIDLPQF